MAPPPGVRPRVHIHGWGVALLMGATLWAALILAGWIAFTLGGWFGVFLFVACLVFVVAAACGAIQ